MEAVVRLRSYSRRRGGEESGTWSQKRARTTDDGRSPSGVDQPRLSAGKGVGRGGEGGGGLESRDQGMGESRLDSDLGLVWKQSGWKLRCRRKGV